MNSEQIAHRLEKPQRKSGGGWLACCPAHEDRNPSLSIDDGRNGVLVNCLAGCSQDAVVSALQAIGAWSSSGKPSNVDYRANLEAKKQRQRDKQLKQRGCRAEASAIWLSSKPAPEDHSYLVRKKVKAHGLRIDKGSLVVPVENTSGELVGLQYIDVTGDKKNLPGTNKVGNFCLVGGKPESILCVAEGFATAATIVEATGHPCAVTFGEGNLLAAAQNLRKKYRDIQIVICADNDRHREENGGVIKGTEAARAVGGLLAVPDFPSGAEGTDFNDLAQAVGLEEVKRQIEAACIPEATEVEVTADPIPLPDDLPPVEPFDYALLPAAVRPWIEDVCERLQCPPDFVAVAVMAALGSLIGRKVGIRPQDKTDWTATANQWALVVGRPGVMKSPALEEGRAPLKRLEAQAKQDYMEQMAAFEAVKAAVELRKESAKIRAKNELKKNPNADITSLLQVEEPEEPILRRYTANDTTPESLAELLRQNQNGLLVYRDEMVSLLKSLDDERNVSGRGFYITGWNGDSSYTIDRIGRGFNQHIEAVCISLLGSTQPGKLAEYVAQATHGGSDDDGLLQRFGLIVWPDVSREWQNVDRWPDKDAKNQDFSVFDRLAELNPSDIGAEQDADYSGKPEGIPYLRFSPEALKLFEEWREELENRLRSDDLHHAVESHFSKYRKLIPSLALIIHLADGGTGSVSAQATLQALTGASIWNHTHIEFTAASRTATHQPPERY